MLETPVAFLVFNRPDTTRRVFAEIARAKPKKLLVIADGPRPDRPGEAEKCAKARAIIDQVDWNCDVLKNYSDINLGCGIRPASGLDWVFEHYEQAIILEDDCVPNLSFFNYCTELLEKYKEDTRIMSISGSNFQRGIRRGNSSYYFSIYTHSWGWATWRRAWKKYDFDMKEWPNFRQTSQMRNLLQNRAELKYWKSTFDSIYNIKRKDIWDYQWLFTCWNNHGLSIIPSVNLVSNIGFSLDATHTKEDIYEVSNYKTEDLRFPLNHPTRILPDINADRFTFNQIFGKEIYRPALWRRIIKTILMNSPHSVQQFIYKIRSI